jgi:prepilin-type N-terminal cleavage/methylation domain-containing protein
MNRSERGFSLIEVLVAGVILLVIALGLVPLYTRSIRSNVEGFDYTHVSNFAKSRAEEYVQLPFNSPRLTLDGGEEQEQAQDFYSRTEHRWIDEDDWPPSAGDTALFTRTATVRQFSVTDLVNPLPGDAPLEAVHLKEITVTVQGSREVGHVLGTGKTIAVRVLKSQ